MNGRIPSARGEPRRAVPRLLPLALLILGGCTPPAPVAPPDDISGGMAAALADTGFYDAVSITRIIGRHYRPAEDAWTIVACYDFTLTDGRQGATCLDSFSAVKLDNDAWVATATVNGVYRWRAIGLAPDAGDVGQAPPPAGRELAPVPDEQPVEPPPDGQDAPPADQEP